MARHRTHSIAFKRLVPTTMSPARRCTAWRRHDLSRTLIRIWVQKYEAGAFDEDSAAVDLIATYEARIAALERLVGKQTPGSRLQP